MRFTVCIMISFFCVCKLEMLHCLVVLVFAFVFDFDFDLILRGLERLMEWAQMSFTPSQVMIQDRQKFPVQ